MGKPALYRLSRLLGVFGVIALVIVVSYVALTVYSISQLRLSTGGPASSVSASGSAVTITTLLPLDNRGPLPINALSIVTELRLPNGTLLVTGHSPATAIPAGTNLTVPVTFPVPLGAGSAAVALLTHSLSLPSTEWANASFGGILTIGIEDTSTFDWGAPFDSLNATVGSPTAQPNGTVALPLEVTYTNRASFDENGAMAFTIVSAGGATCASGSVPVQVPAGQPFSGGTTVYLPASCGVSGGHVTLVYSGNGFTVPLPPEPIP